MRAMWKGAVSFGLVTIPIELYAATESKNVALRQVHQADGGRIQYKRFCSAEGVEVPYFEIAKGFELASGEMVVLTDADFADLPLASVKTIDVLEFVPLAAIDPVYFDQSYFLAPQQVAAKAYRLLLDAMRKSGQVAVAKVALRQREALAVLRVQGDVMVLTTMRWPDEVRTPDFPFLAEETPVPPQELDLASALIDSLSEPAFAPEKYRDAYRQALEDLIQAKISGHEVTRPAAAGRNVEVMDLMTALQASLDETKAAQRRRPERKTAAKKASESDTRTASSPASP